jgi:hypothetical protein
MPPRAGTLGRPMRSTTEQALRRLAGSATAIWLVQCNPRVTDIRASARTALPDSWCVRRHLREIRREDRIVLWLSGADAGVYALGEIAADVHPPAARAVRGAAPAPPTKASLDLFVDLFDRPVARGALKADPRFADESILRQPFAANPHRVSARAFDAILERVATSADLRS